MTRFILASVLLLFVFALPQISSARLMGDESEPNGVYCEINGVKLFAQSSEDCEKAGGSVTHTVTTTVDPVGDNPSEEPEIQRTKDKEPEAP